MNNAEDAEDAEDAEYAENQRANLSSSVSSASSAPLIPDLYLASAKAMIVSPRPPGAFFQLLKQAIFQVLRIRNHLAGGDFVVRGAVET